MKICNYFVELYLTVMVNGSPQALSSVGAAVVPREVVNVGKSNRNAHTSAKRRD